MHDLFRYEVLFWRGVGRGVLRAPQLPLGRPSRVHRALLLLVPVIMFVAVPLFWLLPMVISSSILGSTGAQTLQHLLDSFGTAVRFLEPLLVTSPLLFAAFSASLADGAVKPRMIQELRATPTSQLEVLGQLSVRLFGYGVGWYLLFMLFNNACALMLFAYFGVAPPGLNLLSHLPFGLLLYAICWTCFLPGFWYTVVARTRWRLAVGIGLGMINLMIFASSFTRFEMYGTYLTGSDLLLMLLLLHVPLLQLLGSELERD